MYKNLTVIFVLLTISGCASIKHQPLTKESTENIHGKSIVNTQYEKPDFLAMTAGKAAFAVLGTVAMIAEGNSIIKENNVADPAVLISENLMDGLAKKHNMQVVSNNNTVTTSNRIDDLAEMYASSEYILDIQTMGWSFVYFPTDWNSYRVIYSARLRLIDSASKTVVAEEFCSRMPEYENSNDAPTHKYLVDDNAQGLKTELEVAAEFCINYFNETVFVM